MKRKVERIASELAERMARWEGVETVLLGEAADIEVYDPYFTIDLDVYWTEALPGGEARRKAITGAEAFETSPLSHIDRFLLEELPVSIHYVRAADMDSMLLRIAEKTWVFHEPGTNILFRIERGKVLFSRTGWIDESRAALAHAPDEFWWQARLRAYAAAERALADLGAATWREDDLFFHISSARLARSVASFLFAANRRFEPSGRMLAERIAELPALPDGFTGRLGGFLGTTGPLSREARREIAEHIVRSLLPLALEDPA
jgi:hypothetical protein